MGGDEPPVQVLNLGKKVNMSVSEMLHSKTLDFRSKALDDDDAVGAAWLIVRSHPWQRQTAGDSLQVLLLASNPIGNAGASSIATSLESSPYVRQIDLSSCKIGDAGASSFEAAVNPKWRLDVLS